MAKQPTHIVDHKNLYLATGGKLQHQPMGKQLILTDKQAKALGKRVKAISTGEAADLTGDDGVDEALEALRKRAKELSIPNYPKMKLDTLEAKIAEVEAQIAEANAAAGQQ